MLMRSSSLSLALWSGAALLVVGAVLVRSHKKGEVQIQTSSAPLSSTALSPTNDPRAVALLQKALQVDLGRSYTAQVTSETRCEGKVMRCTAQMTHAPRALRVSIGKGDAQGAQAGYSDRWMWSTLSSARSQPLHAVAELSEDSVAQAQHRFTLLLKNYQVSLSAAPLASGGMKLQVVQLVPRAPLSAAVPSTTTVSGTTTAPGTTTPSRLLAIDARTGLIMRAQICDALGRPVSHYELSQVRWLADKGASTAFVQPQAILAAAHRQTDAWLTQQWQETAQAATRVGTVTGIQPPHPAYLPTNFSLETVGVHYCPLDNQAAATARYTDGLNTLTVFALRPGHDDGPLQNCNYGAAQMAVSAHKGAHVIAIGDLPLAILQRIADSTPVVTTSG